MGIVIIFHDNIFIDLFLKFWICIIPVYILIIFYLLNFLDIISITTIFWIFIILTIITILSTINFFSRVNDRYRSKISDCIFLLFSLPCFLFLIPILFSWDFITQFTHLSINCKFNCEKFTRQDSPLFW